MDWGLLLEIVLVILGIITFFGILVLFIYLSTLTLVFSIVFGVLIGVIVAWATTSCYLSLFVFSEDIGTDIDTVIKLSGLILFLCILLLFALLIFAPSVLVILQVYLSMLYIISIVMGVTLILLAYFALTF